MPVFWFFFIFTLNLSDNAACADGDLASALEQTWETVTTERDERRATFGKANQEFTVKDCGFDAGSHFTCYYDKDGILHHWVAEYTVKTFELDRKGRPQRSKTILTKKHRTGGYQIFKERQQGYNAWVKEFDKRFSRGWQDVRLLELPDFISPSGNLNIETLRIPYYQASRRIAEYRAKFKAVCERLDPSTYKHWESKFHCYYSMSPYTPRVSQPSSNKPRSSVQMTGGLNFPADYFYPWESAISFALSAAYRYADIVEEAASLVNRSWGTIEPDQLPPDFSGRLQVAEEILNKRLEEATAFGALE